MSTTPATAAEVLGRALREDRLAVLIGSRASADAIDTSGRSHRGLPTPTQFVALCAEQFDYVDVRDTFSAACDKILERDNRRGLEDVLLRYYRVPAAVEAPPAHRLLSWLPFSIYLTSNYDQFIERSLEREGRSSHVLIEDADLRQLRRGHSPIVKYHGCVTRPNTMVAASADYEVLATKRRLLEDFVRTSLVGKTLLVVGHGLADADFVRVLRDLAGQLGDYAPAIFVLRSEGHDGHLPGLRLQCEVVAEDLTSFLSRLLQEVRRRDRDGIPRVDEQWLTSAFFAALRRAAGLPSETQVIDAFLAHLSEEFGARGSVADVVADADAAVKLALDVRPNYEALRRSWNAVRKSLSIAQDPGQAELVLRRHIDLRNAAIRQFSNLGAGLVRRNERILLYSQSQRVVQCLLGVPATVQKTMRLFVAECRPKSPSPYQDAVATCKQLADTYYGITVCPDVVAGHLLATAQIDRVLMGTHAIFKEPMSGDLYAFVNTCGAAMIAQTACRHGIPLDVIGEPLKVEEVPSADAQNRVVLHQESDLVDSALGLRDVRTRRGDVDHLNVGYDLVRVDQGVRVHVPDCDY